MTSALDLLRAVSLELHSIVEGLDDFPQEMTNRMRFNQIRMKLLDMLPRVYAVPTDHEPVRGSVNNILRVTEAILSMKWREKVPPRTPVDSVPSANASSTSLLPPLAVNESKLTAPPPASLCAASPSQSQAGERVGLIQSTIVAGPRKVAFKDVSGLSNAKQSLREAIIIPSKHPQLFGTCSGSGRLSPWQCLLLYGPPGTGKSKLAEAVAGEIDSVFYRLSSADLISSFVGESEKLIRELFDQALQASNDRDAKPAVIFIDEIDSLCRSRNARETEGSRRVKTELMVQMQRLCDEGGWKVYLLCATNCPWELDSAFIRRFQKRIYIPLPKKDDRIQLLKHLNLAWLNVQEWSMIGERTDGYSGCDLVTLSNEVRYAPVRQLINAQHWLVAADGRFTPCSNTTPGRVNMSIDQLPQNSISQPRQVNLRDFETALALIKPTVGAADLQSFEQFTSNIGTRG